MGTHLKVDAVFRPQNRTQQMCPLSITTHSTTEPSAPKQSIRRARAPPRGATKTPKPARSGPESAAKPIFIIIITSARRSSPRPLLSSPRFLALSLSFVPTPLLVAHCTAERKEKGSPRAAGQFIPSRGNTVLYTFGDTVTENNVLRGSDSRYFAVAKSRARA